MWCVVIFRNDSGDNTILYYSVDTREIARLSSRQTPLDYIYVHIMEQSRHLTVLLSIAIRCSLWHIIVLSPRTRLRFIREEVRPRIIGTELRINYTYIRPLVLSAKYITPIFLSFDHKTRRGLPFLHTITTDGSFSLFPSSLEYLLFLHKSTQNDIN